MPHLVQILLPIYDNAGNRFPPDVYAKVRFDLTQRFGGLTAYSRAPAEGVWDWWSDYRRQLQELFRQDEIVLRAQSYEPL
jgi:hypothetical protein